jgi:Ca2+-binding RTX toxin-like protein
MESTVSRSPPAVGALTATGGLGYGRAMLGARGMGVRFAPAAVAVVALLTGAAQARASTAEHLGDTLRVTAGGGETNQVEVFEDPVQGDLVVTDTAGMRSPDCSPLDPQTVSCDADGVAEVIVFARDLADRVTVDPSVGLASVLEGAGGDDRLTGSTEGDRLDGGAGDDTLGGGRGRDTLNGLAHDDKISGGLGDDWVLGGGDDDSLDGGGGDDNLIGAFGADAMAGGADIDAVSYAERAAPVFVYANAGPVAGNADDGPAGARDAIAGDVEKLVGSPASDVIWGQSAADLLVSGGPGNDELLAGGGPSLFAGGSGTDTVTYFNRPGPVAVSIGGGADDGGLGSGEGDNVLPDVENLVGTAHDDVLTGDPSANVIDGLNGADAIAGLAGIDTAAYGSTVAAPGALPSPRTLGVTVGIGGAADDGSADDQSGSLRDAVAGDVENLSGTAAGDRLAGGPGANLLAGAGGADLLRGREGNDILLGNDGDDTLDGGAGADRLAGALGVDTASYAGRGVADPVTVTLDGIPADGGAIDDADGPGPLTERDLVTVENVIGGAGDDDLTGNELANVLVGGLGADDLFGLDGDDLLRANDGIADATVDCGGGSGDRARVDAIDPAPGGCEL